MEKTSVVVANILGKKKYIQSAIARRGQCELCGHEVLL